MDGKIFFGFLASLILVLLLTGCAGKIADANQPEQQTNTGQQQEQQNQQATEQQQAVEQPATEPAAVQKFTMEEIAKHSTNEDCWLLISGKVYDVTQFIGSHPGGEAIAQGCGKDATELFETRPMGSGTPHSEKAREYIAKAYIGDLQQ